MEIVKYKVELDLWPWEWRPECKNGKMKYYDDINLSSKLMAMWSKNQEKKKNAANSSQRRAGK